MIIVYGPWQEELFIKSADIYSKVLLSGIETAKEEAMKLKALFLEHVVPGGGTILDVPCGIGRHSFALAEEGFNVVGVDFSPPFIEKARELAEERGVDDRCEFIVGDMRVIGDVLKGYTFNAVVNMFTSIGYYTDETDVDILRQLHGLASQGGILVIDTVNRDWIVRHFCRGDVMTTPDGGLTWLAERKLNLETSRQEMRWRFYKPEGDDLRHVKTVEINHRLYSLHELKGAVEKAGWTYKACYGSMEMGEFTTDANRLVLIAGRE